MLRPRLIVLAPSKALAANLLCAAAPPAGVAPRDVAARRGRLCNYEETAPLGDCDSAQGGALRADHELFYKIASTRRGVEGRYHAQLTMLMLTDRDRLMRRSAPTTRATMFLPSRYHPVKTCQISRHRPPSPRQHEPPTINTPTPLRRPPPVTAPPALLRQRAATPQRLCRRAARVSLRAHNASVYSPGPLPRGGTWAPSAETLPLNHTTIRPLRHLPVCRIHSLRP